MKARILYRIASIMILLFAVGHTVGFRKSDPRWGVDAVLASMRSVRFETQGFSRTYWEFYTGFGLFVSVLLVFAALLAWHLAGMAPNQLASMRTVAWALALCFVVVTFLTWRYFFMAPVIFSAVISLCLIAAAWLLPGSS